MKAPVRELLAGALPACLWLAGCNGVGGHNTYAMARAAPPLRPTGALLVENVWVTGKQDGKPVSAFAPAPVGFEVRLGLVERVDAGVRFGWNLFPAVAWTARGDVLAQLVESRAIDLALDPAFSWTNIDAVTHVDDGGYRRIGSVGVGTLDLPLVAGLNLSESVSLLLIGGAIYGFRNSDDELASDFTEARFPRGFAPRIGLGLDSPAGTRTTFHPEVTAVFSTAEGQRHVIITGGVAFRFRWYAEPAPQPASQ